MSHFMNMLLSCVGKTSKNQNRRDLNGDNLAQKAAQCLSLWASHMKWDYKQPVIRLQTKAINEQSKSKTKPKAKQH